MHAGADDYLVKPLDSDDLQARMIAAARVTALHHDLAQSRREMQDLNDELAAIARRDPLTLLGNRRALQEDLELLESRASRYGHRFCMALVDVDLFKSFNDTYGHQAGDDVLQQVAAARGGDTLYRYGGEEFLCIFPEQSIDCGNIAVERMRSAVEALAIPHAESPTGLLTISAGMAVLDPDRSTIASDVLKAADEALYRAKERGRNRIENEASVAV
jgi:two-component system cell cycle response regulator